MALDVVIPLELLYLIENRRLSDLKNRCYRRMKVPSSRQYSSPNTRPCPPIECFII